MTDRPAPTPLLGEARERMLRALSLASVTMMTPFLVLNFVQGRPLMGVLSVAVVGLFVANLWAVRRTGRTLPWMVAVLVPGIHVFLAAAILRQGVIGVAWCYPGALALYLLVPERQARLANLTLLALTIPLAFHALPLALATRAAATLTLVSVLAAIFVRLINRQHAEVSDANAELAAGLAERERMGEALLEEARRHRRTSHALELALDEASRANEAKSRFLAGMTHELRTPLNAIVGFAEMMDGRAGPITEAQRDDYLAHVLESGERLRGLVNQVLDLAAIEAGRLDLACEEVGLAGTTRRVLAELSGLAEAARVTLHDDVAEARPPYVAADPARLTQCLVNLVGNAIKYNRPGGSVRVGATVAQGTVRLSVTDDGIGIEAARHAQVFETFNRLGATASRVEGSGVGLSLTRELVEGMGGRIGFESEAGRGSTFWIELPVAGPATQAA